MLFDYIYFIQDYQSEYLDSTDSRECQFVIPFYDYAPDDHAAIFLKLNRSRKPFCVRINAALSTGGNGSAVVGICHSVLRLLFLPNYIKSNGKYLIFIDYQGEQVFEVQNTIALLQKELAKQGIKEIIFTPIDSEDPGQTKFADDSEIIVNSELNLVLESGPVAVDFDAVSQRVLNRSNLFKKWIIHVESPVDLERKVKVLNALESWIEITEPVLVYLVSRCRLADRKLYELEKENSLLDLKVHNHITYLNTVKENAQWYIQEHSRLSGELQRNGYSPVSGSEKIMPQVHQLQLQIDREKITQKEIQDWYNKEYEILPKWYKRVGHVLKAVTGKRSFKSLIK